VFPGFTRLSCQPIKFNLLSLNYVDDLGMPRFEISSGSRDPFPLVRVFVDLVSTVFSDPPVPAYFRPWA
jgi:hypothetical protein